VLSRNIITPGQRCICLATQNTDELRVKSCDQYIIAYVCPPRSRPHGVVGHHVSLTSNVRIRSSVQSWVQSSFWLDSTRLEIRLAAREGGSTGFQKLFHGQYPVSELLASMCTSNGPQLAESSAVQCTIPLTAGGLGFVLCLLGPLVPLQCMTFWQN
jgi:hypothetical protein